MTDIDFDELDRAVNSLMQSKQPAGKGDDSRTQSASPQSTSAPTPATAPQAAPIVSGGDRAPEATAQKQSIPANTTPKLSVKKRGQFMDVVHTSSNMKPANSVPKLAPRRSTVTLQPVEGREPVAATSRPPVSTPSPQNLVTEPVKRPAPAARLETQASAPAASDTKWPDPIDSTDNSAPEATDQATLEPLNTPFLPDAKVDKRPLGGLQPSTEVTPVPVSDPDIVQDSTGESDIVALPAELSQDILAVEADAAKQASPESAAEQNSLAQFNERSASPSKNEADAVSASSMPTAATVGSLPQRPPALNNEELASQPDSSIFDTEHYQAPIKHPSKSKRSWPTVVAIIALVILGTVGGVAFYLLSNGY